MHNNGNNIDEINLSDKQIEHFAGLIDGGDDARWQFGHEIAVIVDDIKAELKGKTTPAKLRSKIARIREQAGGKKITRTTVSSWENMARFYAGCESEYNFSWEQYRSLRAARRQWRDLAELVLIQAGKFGGQVAGPACIRVFAKALKGDKLDALLARLEAELAERGTELSPADITAIWQEFNVSDVADWRDTVGRIVELADDARHMDGVPVAVADLLAGFADDVAGAMGEDEATDALP